MGATPAWSVLIVGAATPVGRWVSRALADEGAQLLLTDVTVPHLNEVADEIAERTGRQPARRVLRVTDPNSWSAAIEAAEALFGRLDLIVNAAEFNPAVPWQEAGPDDWSLSLGINLLGVVHGIAAGLPALRRSAGAFIVVAVEPSAPSKPLLSAARSGALAFAEAIRSEVAPEVAVAAVAVTEGDEAQAGGRVISEMRSGKIAVAADPRSM
ncbi:MAG: SDR family NAD(P)-dependent oxidoreductase [Arthrobacter sp.]